MDIKPENQENGVNHANEKESLKTESDLIQESLNQVKESTNIRAFIKESPQISDSNDLNPAPTKKERIKRNYNVKTHGNRYSLAQKLAIKAIQSAEVSSTHAATILKANPRTIQRIWNDPELEELVPQSVGKIKTGLGGLFYKRALGAALTITPEKLAQSSALQLATVAGIMTEKGRLMEGLSTENVAFKGVAASIDEDRQKLMKRLEDLEGK